MINFKKVSKESVGKGRSKSIYRGNQTHTLSMNIKIENDFSPDPLQNKQTTPYKCEKKQTDKENKALKYKQSLKILEVSNSGKKTTRQDISKSVRKMLQNKPMETQRYFREKNNQTSRKSILFKREKSNLGADIKEQHTQNKSISGLYGQKLAVNEQQLKSMLRKMRTMKEENERMKKELEFYRKENSKNAITRVLRI